MSKIPFQKAITSDSKKLIDVVKVATTNYL